MRVTHDLIASPSRWTVHAPHCALPQPYLVPVSPITSRSTQSSGIAGSTSTDCFVPLIVRLIALIVRFLSMLSLYRYRGYRRSEPLPHHQSRTPQLSPDCSR